MTIINSVIKGKQPVIDTLNVTPTTSAQQITATGGTDGYSPVNVSAVTSSIDANIVAGNIKKDVQILGVTGSYEGTTPTGTKSITSNGVYDVTDFASADVQVPTTAPARYLEFEVDASGQLMHSTTASNLINLNGATDIGAYALYYAYANNTGITTVDLSGLTKISGSNACCYAFSGATNITSVDLSNLTQLLGSGACDHMFQGCTGLTGSINLSSLNNVSINYACANMFQGCTGITSVDLSGLEFVDYAGNSACQYMFNGCTSLTSFDLSNLKGVWGQNAFVRTFLGCTSLTTADLSSVRFLGGSNCWQYTFDGCSSLSNVDISGAYLIGTNNNFSYMFRNCTSLSSLSFDSLVYRTNNLNSCFQNMLSGCSNVTVHFPAEWQTDMASYSNITNGLGGTNTTVLFDLPNVRHVDLSFLTDLNASNRYGSMFSNCTAITSVDLSNVKKCVGNYLATYMFSNCTSLISVDLGKLEVLGYGSSTSTSMFSGDTSLTTVNLDSLVYAPNGLQEFFNGCSSLQTLNLKSLKINTPTANLTNAFKNSGLTSLSFPALTKYSISGQFQNMCSGVANVTIHFPSNTQTTVQNATGYSTTAPFGAVSGTVLFDLPATNILTGVNTTVYERNPKYDTATALAWRVQDTGTAPNITIDWTPFYTSGLTDPTVGTTIYSDSACTIVETTVDSIV